MTFNREAFEAFLESDGEIKFDIYAQDPNDWSELQRYIPGIVISSAGGIVPFQAEGILNGMPFYLRDRHGSVRLSLGEPDGEMPYTGRTTLYTAYAETEEFAGGENFIKNLLKLIPMLEKAPFPYEFSGKKLIWAEGNQRQFTVSETETETHVGWGNTPKEAFEELQKPSPYLLEHGWSEAFQREMFIAQEFNKTPVVTDNRKFPETAPVFQVNI